MTGADKASAVKTAATGEPQPERSAAPTRAPTVGLSNQVMQAAARGERPGTLSILRSYLSLGASWRALSGSERALGPAGEGGGVAGRQARIHDDARAAGLLRELGAAGLTVGRDVLLAPAGGARHQATLRHELRHVAQTGGRAADLAHPFRLSGPREPAEREAYEGSSGLSARADPNVAYCYYDENELLYGSPRSGQAS